MGSSLPFKLTRHTRESFSSGAYRLTSRMMSGWRQTETTSAHRDRAALDSRASSSLLEKNGMNSSTIRDRSCKQVGNWDMDRRI